MWYNLTDKDQNNVAGSYKNVARFTLYTLYTVTHHHGKVLLHENSQKISSPEDCLTVRGVSVHL